MRKGRDGTFTLASRRKAGTHLPAARAAERWIPAFAGTRFSSLYAPCLCGECK